MAAIQPVTFRTSGAKAEGTGLTIAPSLPSTYYRGDLFICQIATSSTGTDRTSSCDVAGWSLWNTSGTTGGALNQQVWIKAVEYHSGGGGTVESPPTFSRATSGSVITAIIHVAANCSVASGASAAIDANANGAGSTSNETTATSPTLTPANNDTTVAALMAAKTAAAAGSVSFSGWTNGYTEVADVVSTSGTLVNRACALATLAQTTAASTSTAATLSTSSSWTCLLIPLIPQAKAQGAKWANVAYAATSAQYNVMHIEAPTAGYTGNDPIIMFVHGGPFSGGQRHNVQNGTAPMEVLSQGCFLVSVDYRPVDATHTWTSGRDDLKAAVRWLKANGATYGMKATNIVAFGTSFGAPGALMLALTPNKSGMHDLTQGNSGELEDILGCLSWFGGYHPKWVDDESTALGITQSPLTCSTSSGISFMLGTTAAPVNPCSLAAWDDAVSPDTSENQYNKFAVQYWATRGTYSFKPAMRVSHGTLDQTMPWYQSYNDQTGSPPGTAYLPTPITNMPAGIAFDASVHPDIGDPFTGTVFATTTFATDSEIADFTISTQGTADTAFQNALNSCASIDNAVIEVAPGIILTGPFTFPVRTGAGYCEVRSTHINQMTPRGVRFDLANDTPHAFIIKNQNASNGLAFKFAGDGSDRYRMRGWLGALSTGSGKATAVWGAIGIDPNQAGGVATGAGTLAGRPDSIVFEKFSIDQTDSIAGSEIRHCIWVNATQVALLDFIIQKIHSANNEAQCVYSPWGAEKLKIINGYLQAAGECIMNGGAPLPGNLSAWVPKDWECRYSTYNGYPLDVSTKQWVEKNLTEMKSIERILMTGNIYQYHYEDGQAPAIKFVNYCDTGSQGGTNNLCNDVTFWFNQVLDTPSFLVINGKETFTATPPTNRGSRFDIRFITVANQNIAPYKYLTGNNVTMISIGNDAKDVVLDHITVVNVGASNGKMIYMNNSGGTYGQAVTDFTFTNSAIYQDFYGLNGDSLAEGTPVLTALVAGTLTWDKVILYAGSSGTNYPAGTTFAPSQNSVFPNFAIGDLNVTASAQDQATDGFDIGSMPDWVAARVAATGATLTGSAGINTTPEGVVQALRSGGLTCDWSLNTGAAHGYTSSYWLPSSNPGKANATSAALVDADIAWAVLLAKTGPPQPSAVTIPLMFFSRGDT